MYTILCTYLFMYTCIIRMYIHKYRLANFMPFFHKSQKESQKDPTQRRKGDTTARVFSLIRRVLHV